jgi:hypothetical protein
MQNRFVLGLLLALLSSLTSPVSHAQDRQVFTVASRDEQSVTSYVFYCDDHGNQLDCALARTTIRPKLTADQVEAFTHPGEESLKNEISLYTSGGTLCRQNLDDQAVVRRVLGAWAPQQIRATSVISWLLGGGCVLTLRRPMGGRCFRLERELI